jgi:hypothetical protein
MDYEDRITVYWVSPRMFIHHGIVQGSGFTYASNFYHEGITVFTQLEPELNGSDQLNLGHFRLRV